jgi:hypothetical protein
LYTLLTRSTLDTLLTCRARAAGNGITCGPSSPSLSKYCPVSSVYIGIRGPCVVRQRDKRAAGIKNDVVDFVVFVELERSTLDEQRRLDIISKDETTDFL